MTAAETALAYLEQGWRVVPVEARDKRPRDNAWQKLMIDAAAVSAHFPAGTNIGVVLGDASGGLVDVDLDCPEALALGPLLLPPTVEFGRASARRSHWLYLSRGARTEKLAQALGGGRADMLVELRANGATGSPAVQTVFPGSIHPSGEPIEWEADAGADSPVAIAPEPLRLLVARLAAAALLMRLEGWSLEQAAAWGRAPSAPSSIGDVAYAQVARWLGFPTRALRPVPAPTPRVQASALKRASAYLAKVEPAVSGQGGHLNAWKAALSVVRGFDLDERDAFDLLAREYNPRCEPPWSDRELEHKVASAARDARLERGYLLRVERPNHANGHARPISAPAAAQADSWEPPVEFDVFDLPSFPVHALPEPIADFVRTLARATQTPVDLPAMLCLAACAAAVAKYAVVEVKPGYKEPLNLFTAVILPPGERKSAVVKEVVAPLVEWEAKQADLAKPAIARSNQQYFMSKKRLEAATDRAAKAKKKEEREQLEMEALELSEQHARLIPATEPRILADDATPEALASLLAQHGGRMAAFSAEGGIFQMMAGKYTESPSLDVYLKAHAGDEIRVDRKGRSSERVTDPALTLGLAIQPSILEALAEKPMLRGTGLLARFLYAMPTSMLGSRIVDAPPITDSVRDGYASALRRLLLLQGLKHQLTLKLSPEAYQEWRSFAEWIEPQLAEFGDMDSIRDWSGKLSGAASRIAAILGILRILAINNRFQDLSISIYIDRDSMVHAIEIGKYLVPHARAAFSSMGADSRMQGAKALLSCLRRKAWTSFSRRELQQSVKGSQRFNDADALDVALDILKQRHFIREAPQPPVIGRGRPPSPSYEVNPGWLVEIKIPRQNSQYSQKSGSA